MSNRFLIGLSIFLFALLTTAFAVLLFVAQPQSKATPLPSQPENTLNPVLIPRITPLLINTETPPASPSNQPTLQSTALAPTNTSVPAASPTMPLVPLYGLPQIDSAVVLQVPANTPLLVLGRLVDSSWYAVRQADSPLVQNGWLPAAYVQLASAQQSQVAVIPPPSALLAVESTLALTELPALALPSPSAVLPSPSPTISFLADSQVTTNNLRLRAEPNLNSQILRELGDKTPLQLQGRSDNSRWMYVSTSDHLQGWVMAEYLQFTTDPQKLPVAQIIPQATQLAGFTAVAQVTAVANTAVAQVTAVAQATAIATSGNAAAYARSDQPLRSIPNASGNALGSIQNGQPLQPLQKSPDNQWLQVRSGDGSLGWVQGNSVELRISWDVLSIPAELLPPPTAIPPTAVPTAVPPTAVPPTAAPVVAVAIVPAQPSSGGDYFASRQGQSLSLGAAAFIFGVNGRAAEIYARGQALGNRRNVFAKVGDSITAGDHSGFMAQFGFGNYNLASYGYLQGAVDIYSKETADGGNLSFNRSSQAAGNGWLAENILAGGSCGQSNLLCEYQTTKPSLALIMIGTNDSGGIALGTYEVQLHQIVETSINQGVIPVLFTIPPKRYNPATDGRVAEFNRVIITTAWKYNIPWVDYWQAMVLLPNQGLSGDGVHPSDPGDQNAVFTPENLQFGTTVRNLLGLEMLYQLRNAVLGW